MKTIRSFRVFPNIPDELDSLKRIAYNLWWCWHPDAIDLYRRLDLDNYSKSYHNPVALLGMVDQEVYKQAVKSPVFREHLDRVDVMLTQHLQRTSWFEHTYGGKHPLKVAYYSAEFGIHECLPIYSGGLGVLAGDHLKSASELGIPLVGVGLAYRKGYFHQYLNTEGWQLEKYPELDFYNMPISLVRDEQDNPVIIELGFPDKKVFVQAWLIQVGRIPLYLLDSNVEMNSKEDREITTTLYGGNVENRIKQEFILGVGGTLLLDRLNIHPNVFHLNEGHSAFLSLARIEKLMKVDHLSFKESQEVVRATNIFTTHTPVPAGIDRFDPNMVLKYFKPFCDQVGMDTKTFLGLGREDIGNDDETFSMAVLAIKLSNYCNGVSKLHGTISRKMWNQLWPGVPVDEIPIQHITNGIHIRSWLSDEMTSLFNRYLGPTWVDESAGNEVWDRIDNIPPSELWRAKERLRVRLVGYVRKKLQKQLAQRGASSTEIQSATEILDPECLTIGFARRFAEYKRAKLIFSDPDRLDRIVNNPGKPLQLIFAGKAHPADNIGKDIIKTLVSYAKQERFRKRLVFIEDYDINVARYLVQGVDLWLNNPRRPREASGTSGMKVPPNGGLNLSILDGWWVEGYNGKNGWAIGNGEEYTDSTYQDQVESKLLYQILEEEIIPTFYDRGTDGVPRQWTEIMKNSMKTLCPVFNTNRQVRDYTEMFYIPASHANESLTAHTYQNAKTLIVYLEHMNQNWHDIKIVSVKEQLGEHEIKVGDKIPITVSIQMGKLKPDDIKVELYFGPLDANDQFMHARNLRMHLEGYEHGGTHKYACSIECSKAGINGYAVRILPVHANLYREFEPNRILWG